MTLHAKQLGCDVLLALRDAAEFAARIGAGMRDRALWQSRAWIELTGQRMNLYNGI